MMRKARRFAACLGSLLGMNVYAQTGSPPAEGRIGAILAEMTQAANAHDTDRFMAAYRRGPGLVFAINGMVIHGWDALHAQQLQWWHNGKSDVVYTQIGPTEFTALASDLVVSTQTMSSRRTGPYGKPSAATFAITDVWRKSADGWQIVYAHESGSR